MAVPGLAEATDEYVVTRLEEEDLWRDVARLERAHGLAIGQCRISAARVEHQRDALELTRLASDELRQPAQQLRRQVVDDAEADVLEQLAGGRLAGTGQAADDRDVWFSSGARALFLLHLAYLAAAGPGADVAGAREGALARATSRMLNS